MGCLRILLVWIALSAVSLGDSASFSVCTYNIRYNTPKDGQDAWPHRMPSVAGYISQHDVIGLQEVTRGQLDDLVGELSEFSFYGVGRDDGKSGGEHACIFYRKDRFELMESKTLWLCDTPDAVGRKGWDAALPRTMTHVLLRDRTNNLPIMIINTHFDHVGKQARFESARLIAKTLPDPGKSTVPVIVMGDFNCVPDSPPYRALAEALQDARELQNPSGEITDSTWNGFQKVVPNRIIDHVFVRGSLIVDEFSIENPQTPQGRFASDHLPVVIQARLRANPNTPK